MAEKRGETEKLTYDFNTAGCLEIKYKGKDIWYRVTSKEFRSFNGPRRITAPTHAELGNVDIPLVRTEYFGPVFLYGTNKEVPFTNEGDFARGDKWYDRIRQSENRGR